MKASRELPLPDAAVRDENSVEMLRVWIAEGALFCSLKIGMYAEEGKIAEEDAWGMIFADAIRHVASGLCSGYDRSLAASLSIIRARVAEELDRPTTEVSGGFVQ